MERQYFKSDGLALSYLDAGGGGAPPIALHSHWMEAETFVHLRVHLIPRGGQSLWISVAMDTPSTPRCTVAKTICKIYTFF
jgi:hypothetical protein